MIQWLIYYLPISPQELARFLKLIRCQESFAIDGTLRYITTQLFWIKYVG